MHSIKTCTLIPTLDLVSTVYWIILNIPPGHTSKLFDSKVIYLPERCSFGLFFFSFFFAILNFLVKMILSKLSSAIYRVDFIMNNLSNTLYLL